MRVRRAFDASAAAAMRDAVWRTFPLQVVETIGEAGDVYLLHPLVLHVAAPNNAAEPRFMLSGGVTTDMWGWNLQPDGEPV